MSLATRRRRRLACACPTTNGADPRRGSAWRAAAVLVAAAALFAACAGPQDMPTWHGVPRPHVVGSVPRPLGEVHGRLAAEGEAALHWAPHLAGLHWARAN